MACRYMALTSSPRHARIQPEYTVSNAPGRQRSVTAARSLAAADACSISEDQLSSRQPSAANVQQDDITRRRALHLSAAALLWVSAAQTLQSLPAVASPALGVQTAFKAGSTYSPAAADFEEFRGKGGFTLRRPANSGWVIAFVSAPYLPCTPSSPDLGSALLALLLVSVHSHHLKVSKAGIYAVWGNWPSFSLTQVT